MSSFQVSTYCHSDLTPPFLAAPLLLCSKRLHARRSLRGCSSFQNPGGQNERKKKKNRAACRRSTRTEVVFFPESDECEEDTLAKQQRTTVIKLPSRHLLLLLRTLTTLTTQSINMRGRKKKKNSATSPRLNLNAALSGNLTCVSVCLGWAPHSRDGCPARDTLMMQL